MSEATTWHGRWLAAALLLLSAGTAEAAEILVLSAGAVRAIVTELAQAFEKESGHKVTLAFATVGVTRKRLAEEPADVVIMSDVAIDEASAQGAVVAGSRTDIARTGMLCTLPRGQGTWRGTHPKEKMDRSRELGSAFQTQVYGRLADARGKR
jgi:ABC-type molybdate transport system substrate-binding protein